MQPHSMWKDEGFHTLDPGQHPAHFKPFIEAVQENHKAIALVTAWQHEGCHPENLQYTFLEKAIEEAITFTKDDALKVKGKLKDNTEALNIGYLDRLFVLVDDEITKVDRDLEVQAMLYGGDHLPQLFHVIATSVPKVAGVRKVYKANPYTTNLGYDANPIPLELATTQLFTTTPAEPGSTAGYEYTPHVHFGTSNLEKQKRTFGGITKSPNSLRTNANANR